MRFEWNQDKDRSNQAKHHLSFETACLVFEDPFHLSIQDRFEYGEERWITLGMVDGLVLIVAHTGDEYDQDEVIRIISARKATRYEQRIYEQAY